MIERKREALRHHAHHDVRHRIERDTAANDRRVAAEPAVPLTVADHHHAGAGVAFVIRQQIPAEQRRCPRQREGCGRDFGNTHRLGIGLRGREVLLDGTIRADVPD
jgi:hypothetical protein